MQITKDADRFLCEIYEEYLYRRKSGISKSDAKRFSTPEELVEDFMQGTLPQDIRDGIQELYELGLVKRFVTGTFSLDDTAIIYMENRFKNGLKEVADFITKFI